MVFNHRFQQLLILSMGLEHVITNDGSSSIYVKELDEHYHSSHGALQEARHVFIENGLSVIKKDRVHVFEMGLGTGLNALLTNEHALKHDLFIHYTGIEAYPVPEEITHHLNYAELIDGSLKDDFNLMHSGEWGVEFALNDRFSLTKVHDRIENYIPESEVFDLIYFDAFGYRAQSEMWDISILRKMFESLKAGGILVTYAARGQLKRDLKQLGFHVESLPGPPGKREMTRAIKP